jgi:hypothetical protein
MDSLVARLPYVPNVLLWEIQHSMSHLVLMMILHQMRPGGPLYVVSRSCNELFSFLKPCHFETPIQQQNCVPCAMHHLEKFQQLLSVFVARFQAAHKGFHVYGYASARACRQSDTAENETQNECIVSLDTVCHAD